MSFLDLASKINILNESGISSSDYSYNNYIRDMLSIETSMYNTINECANSISTSAIEALTEGTTIDSDDIKTTNKKMNKDLCDLWEKSNDNFISFITSKCDSTHKIIIEYIDLINNLNMDLTKIAVWKENKIEFPRGLLSADFNKVKITKTTSKEIRAELTDYLIRDNTAFAGVNPKIIMDNIKDADAYINNKKNEYIKCIKKPSNISGNKDKYTFKTSKNITDSDLHIWNEILRIKTVEYKELCYVTAKYCKACYDTLKKVNNAMKSDKDFRTHNAKSFNLNDNK